ncbi:MAG TPA: glycine betaine ABC transporter substrate-binding protein [Vicinamibacterales bacterium]|nr:glycine betaine ABC transporter substrate-binding protein [Vicinamibacterales bacterium]
MTLFRFLSSHHAEFLHLLLQHVMLVGWSTFAAILVGIPVGIVAARRPRLGAPIVWLANVVQTIPSLAMFGFLLPLPYIGGLGARVAIVVLILYALLPIIRTTVAGIRGVDPVLTEAGRALGMTPRQLLTQVELPLALPTIVAGIRVAAVIGVGTATIAAAIGAGGLGEYIFRGLSMVDPTVILAGAVPAALLALAVDGLLFGAEAWLKRRRARSSRMLPAAAVLVIVIAAAFAAVSAARPPREAIRVGSKNFTEQIILGELLAQTIERDTGITVERRLNLGGTFIADRALRAGDIDVYIEYTGTADTAIFRNAPETDPARVLDRVRAGYAAAGLTVLPPLGFDNTFAILVRGDDARRLGLRTIEDAVPPARRWTPGFGYEFLQRADGYPGLVRTYGFRFAAPPVAMDLSLIYRALADRRVDLIAGDATSGLIAAYDLAMLRDNRRYFPPYDAVPVARAATLLRHPEVRAALESLAGRIGVEDMRRMNYAVDVGRQDPSAVARDFLARLERGRTSKP